MGSGLAAPPAAAGRRGPRRGAPRRVLPRAVPGALELRRSRPRRSESPSTVLALVGPARAGRRHGRLRPGGRRLARPVAADLTGFVDRAAQLLARADR